MATPARQRPTDSPLSQPIHRLTLLPGSPPWRDNVDRRAGFWVPMGALRRAPAIRAYDEFVALRTSNGDNGFGVVEQAVVHRLF
jgi:hypothetical protein